VTPGGGFLASGHSMEVMQLHLDKKKHLDDFEKQIKSDPEQFLKSVFGNDLSLISNNNLNFKLIKENGKHHLLELNNDLKIEFNK